MSAQQLLFRQDDHLANLSGLKQLIALQHKNLEDDKLIQHIDLITSSGFKLENAQLQKVDFQKIKVNLIDAELNESILLSVELQAAELNKAILKGLIYPLL